MSSIVSSNEFISNYSKSRRESTEPVNLMKLNTVEEYGWPDRMVHYDQLIDENDQLFEIDLNMKKALRAKQRAKQSQGIAKYKIDVSSKQQTEIEIKVESQDAVLSSHINSGNQGDISPIKVGD